MSTPSTIPSFEWVSIKTLALRLGRPYGTVARWCNTGVITDFGYRVQRDIYSRYWIGVPTTSTSLTTPLTLPTH